MRLQKWIALFVIGGILGAMQCAFMVGKDWNLSEIIYMLGFGGVYIAKSSMGDFAIAWFPILFFQVWLGNYIYEHYCVSSVYFFSRCTKKVTWYLKESGKLYLMALLYVMMLILGAYLIVRLGNLEYHILWDKPAGILLFYYVAIYSFWLFATTLLINVIGILWDSSKGFVLVVGAQLICTAVYAILSEWLDFMGYNGEGMEAQILVLKLIPASNLVLKWHSNNLVGTPVLESVFGFEYELIYSVIGLFLAACIVLVGGVCVVKRSDFLDNGRVM